MYNKKIEDIFKSRNIISDITWFDEFNAEFHLENILVKITNTILSHGFIKFQYNNHHIIDDVNEKYNKVLSIIPTIEKALYDVLARNPNGIIFASNDEYLNRLLIYDKFHNNFSLKEQWNFKIIDKPFVKFYIVLKKDIDDNIIDDIINSIPNNGKEFNKIV